MFAGYVDVVNLYGKVGHQRRIDDHFLNQHYVEVVVDYQDKFFIEITTDRSFTYLKKFANFSKLATSRYHTHHSHADAFNITSPQLEQLVSYTSVEERKQKDEGHEEVYRC